jgi:putative oxidoreductase
MTPILQLLGRILISVIFIGGGYGKLMAMPGTIAYIAAGGLPMPEAAFWVAVLIELGLGLTLLFGLFTRASGAALAAWCLITAALFHSNFADHNMMIHFLKNVAMAGGLLYVAAFGGGALSLDAVLLRRTIGARAVA